MNEFLKLTLTVVVGTLIMSGLYPLFRWVMVAFEDVLTSEEENKIAVGYISSIS